MKAKTIKQRVFLPLIVLSGLLLLAQGNRVSGITEANQKVTSYFDLAIKLIYAIGAVVGLIVAATILRSFFLETMRL